MADIKTPFGNVPKPVVYISILAGGGALVYATVKKKNKAKAAATSASTTANTAANMYGYGSSSYAYGYGTGVSPYGYGAYNYEPYGYGYGPEGLGAYGGEGLYGYGYYNSGVPVEVPQQATTNAQWSQAAVSALSAAGWTQQQVLSALGPYLQGQGVSQSQAEIIDAAIAAEGYPPVEGTGGYPPAIKTSGGGGGGQNSGTVPVPNVVGLSQVQAAQVLNSSGLKFSGSKETGPKGTVYYVTSESPKAGTQVNTGTTVTCKASPKK